MRESLADAYAPLSLPDTGSVPFTDYANWRLRVSDGGRHTWHYLKNDEEREQWRQTTLDRYWLGMPIDVPELPPAQTPLEAARNGYEFYKNLQAEDGHWPGEYGGPMFLMPGLVIGSYVSGMSFKEEERLEMIRYLLNRASPEDGGWGIHVEGHSTVFGTALNYTALRILGCSAEHPIMVRARETLHKLGGATGAPAWGKFWLSILNVYEWEGNNSVFPEIWLLPDWTPMHPSKWWIHVRTVQVPMSYLSGCRFKHPENELILALRKELYPQDYYKIDWPAQRNNIAQADIYAPHTKLFDLANVFLGLWEDCPYPPLRKRALDRTYEMIVMEDENTAYQTLGPVSKMMNLIARTHREGVGSEAWRRHRDARDDFMWLGAEGMMMCGTNGSQLWDIAFVTQALVESGLGEEQDNRESLIKALGWLEQCQMTENPVHHEAMYRHRTKGAWPFSTKAQGYTVSDCTGEGLKSALYLQKHLDFTPDLISDRRIFDAVDTMLTMQNPCGGFASYELIRGPAWLERLNPAEVFGNIMIEYAYPECTTSVITALAIFRQYYPEYRSADIQKTLDGAIKYLHDAQKPDGGWTGSWGICFTYSSQFALESLSLVGETYVNSPSVRRACEFLIGKQREDGGWGESYKACELGRWIDHKETQVVQTCWAAMALMYARYPFPEPIEKAVKLVMSRQLPNGSWAQEAIEGVFNKNVAIAYPNFKFSFTIWMLGKAHRYLEELRRERGEVMDLTSTATTGNGNGHAFHEITASGRSKEGLSGATVAARKAVQNGRAGTTESERYANGVEVHGGRANAQAY